MSRGTQEIAEILQHISTQKTLALVSLNLYEVYDDARRYSQLYEHLFSLPEGDTSRKGRPHDVLVDIKVLIEDIVFHSNELHEQLDGALVQIDPERESSA
jgi:hypothetical protein